MLSAVSCGFLQVKKATSVCRYQNNLQSVCQYQNNCHLFVGTRITFKLVVSFKTIAEFPRVLINLKVSFKAGFLHIN